MCAICFHSKNKIGKKKSHFLVLLLEKAAKQQHTMQCFCTTLHNTVFSLCPWSERPPGGVDKKCMDEQVRPLIASVWVHKLAAEPPTGHVTSPLVLPHTSTNPPSKTKYITVALNPEQLRRCRAELCNCRRSSDQLAKTKSSNASRRFRKHQWRPLVLNNDCVFVVAFLYVCVFGAISPSTFVCCAGAAGWRLVSAGKREILHSYCER